MAKQQVYWEDVQKGQEIPGYELECTPSLVVKQVSGSQDFYEVHHDQEFARGGGHADIFLNTGFTRAALARMLTDWAGDKGWLRRLRIEMRRMNRPGDVLRMRGKVIGKEVRNGERCVDLEVWVENDREGITTPSQATVILPSRN